LTKKEFEIMDTKIGYRAHACQPTSNSFVILKPFSGVFVGDRSADNLQVLCRNASIRWRVFDRPKNLRKHRTQYCYGGGKVIMSFDAFILIDGIEGESSDDKHHGWIEVLNCGVGVKQTVSRSTSSAGGATAERAQFHNFNFTKQMDIASPQLALECAAGTHIDTIKVEFCRAGTEKVKFMEYKLTNCIISEVIMIAGGDFPVESVNIDYGKIEWCYTLQKREGGGTAGNLVTGWDLQRNCKM
jgi:type VI secretion system secreted protein Hcp